MNVNSVVASVAVVGVTVAAVESAVLFAAVIVAVDGAVVADVAGTAVDAAVAVVGVAEEAAVADAACHSFPNDVASANQHLVQTDHHALLLSFFAHAGLAAGFSDEYCGSEILVGSGDGEAGKGVFVLVVVDV